MSDHNGSTAFFLLLVLVVCMKYGFVCVSGYQLNCIEKEREALLRFKKDLIDDHGVLSSWGTEDHKKDCCKWKAILCSNTTGHVIVLRLADDYPVKLAGLPASLSEFSELEVLDVASNSLEDTITEANLAKLHSLIRLDLSLNSLTIRISPGWTPPFQLSFLNIAGSNIGPHFPSWIQTQSDLLWLDLSCSDISGEIPKWFWSWSPSLKYLNLSHNQISGTIPHFSSQLIGIDVSFNNLSGPIPLLHPNTKIFQLSQNMFSGSISSICTIHQSHRTLLLDLSSNQLAGELPKCWENMTEVRFLNLANNGFSGEIPHALGSLLDLGILHLRNNNLSGELPSTLKNCKDLKLIDIGGNKLTGNIPPWIGAYYTNLAYLSFDQNRFYGRIPPEICNLTHIQVLDLSRNNLSGKIPQCFSNFTTLLEKDTPDNMIGVVFPNGLTFYDDFSLDIINEYIDYALVQWKGRESEYRKILGLLKLIDLSSNRLVGNIPHTISSLKALISLNLSRNGLTGEISPDIGKMEMLECLDLSSNQLSGTIPIGLAKLDFLDVLDLANNNLSGRIPSGTQLQNFNASVYPGNRELCGPPLPLCQGDSISPSIPNQGEHIREKNDGFMSLSFWENVGISIVFGFIVGFWGFVGSLLLKKSWRIAYFNFWDGVGDWLYITITIFFRKFRPS